MRLKNAISTIVCLGVAFGVTSSAVADWDLDLWTGRDSGLAFRALDGGDQAEVRYDAASTSIVNLSESSRILVGANLHNRQYTENRDLYVIGVFDAHPSDWFSCYIYRRYYYANGATAHITYDYDTSYGVLWGSGTGSDLMEFDLGGNGSSWDYYYNWAWCYMPKSNGGTLSSIFYIESNSGP